MSGFKGLLREDSGGAVVLVVLMLVSLLGFTGLTIDGAALYLTKEKLQYALDAASMAGAQELPDHTAAAQTALDYVEANGLDRDGVEVSFEDQGRILALTSRQPVDFRFMRVLGFEQGTVRAESAAAKWVGFPAFEYAVFSGSTTRDLRSSITALHIQGSIHTNADCRITANDTAISGACEAVGGVFVPGGGEPIPYPRPGSPYIPVPDLSQEVRDLAQVAYYTGQDYTGRNLEMDGSIYVNGEVHLGGGSSFSGVGTILASGDIHINGNHVNTSAGDAICICSQGDIHINGTDMVLVGIIYAPEGRIEINATNLTIQGAIIAREIVLSGSQITIQGDSSQEAALPSYGTRLVR